VGPGAQLGIVNARLDRKRRFNGGTKGQRGVVKRKAEWQHLGLKRAIRSEKKQATDISREGKPKLTLGGEIT